MFRFELLFFSKSEPAKSSLLVLQKRSFLFPLIKPLKNPKIFRALRAQLSELSFFSEFDFQKFYPSFYFFQNLHKCFQPSFCGGGGLLMLSPWYRGFAVRHTSVVLRTYLKKLKTLSPKNHVSALAINECLNKSGRARYMLSNVV